MRYFGAVWYNEPDMKKILFGLVIFSILILIAPKVLAYQEWVDGGYRQSSYSGLDCGNSPFTCYISEDYVEAKYNQDMARYYAAQNTAGETNDYSIIRQLSLPVYAGEMVDGRLYCYFGYVEDPQTKRCEKISVPENAALSESGKGWSCLFGFKKVYGQDVCELDSVPSVAKIKLGTNTDDWGCVFGFKKAFGGCERLIFPAHGHADSEAKDGWDCDKGYERTEDGDFCQKIEIPANAKLSVTGKSWVCNSGYVVQYLANDQRTCVKAGRVKSPIRAVAGVKKLSCKFGYEDSGGECTKILIPLNGQLAADGKSWVCKAGYRKVGGQCQR